MRGPPTPTKWRSERHGREHRAFMAWGRPHVAHRADEDERRGMGAGGGSRHARGTFRRPAPPPSDRLRTPALPMARRWVRRRPHGVWRRCAAGLQLLPEAPCPRPCPTAVENRLGRRGGRQGRWWCGQLKATRPIEAGASNLDWISPQWHTVDSAISGPINIGPLPEGFLEDM